MASTRRQVGTLLTASVREHDWTAAEPSAVALARSLPPDRIVEAASFHRVVGCVAASLAGGDVPEPLTAALGAATRRATGQAVLAAAALRAVRDAFGDDLPWLTVKGPVLDAALYPRPRLRTYRDLDLLVAPAQLEHAVERLEGVGFRLADRNWRQIRERMVSQLHLEREGSAPIDLHWTLLFDAERRTTFRFPMDAMTARSRVVEVAGGPVRTFDEVDTLIHLAMHAAIEGGGRLVWLKDVDVAARADLDWDALIRRASDYGMQLPVATVLSRSRSILGAPVPHWVTAALAPRSWRTLTSALDAAFPASASLGLGSPATLLARSARNRVATSLRVAAMGLARRSQTTITEGHVARVDRRFDPDHEGSLLHAAGGTADREAYFAQLRAL